MRIQQPLSPPLPPPELQRSTDPPRSRGEGTKLGAARCAGKGCRGGRHPRRQPLPAVGQAGLGPSLALTSLVCQLLEAAQMQAARGRQPCPHQSAPVGAGEELGPRPPLLLAQQKWSHLCGQSSPRRCPWGMAARALRCPSTATFSSDLSTPHQHGPCPAPSPAPQFTPQYKRNNTAPTLLAVQPPAHSPRSTPGQVLRCPSTAHPHPPGPSLCRGHLSLPCPMGSLQGLGGRAQPG